MKISFLTISYVLILITSIINCSSESLPFLKGDYIYWLFTLTIVTLFLALKNKIKTLKINVFDRLLILLSTIGIINFVFLSKATIYNTAIWNYTGYLTFYLLLRNYCSTTDATKKTLVILLYFCSITSIFNLFWMFLQWKQLVSSPNEFFLTTGIFFSPNQLGIYLTIGLLSTLYLLDKTEKLWLKVSFGLSLLLIFTGLCISESRGAFISLCVAMIYYFYQSKKKLKPVFNWKIYLGIALFTAFSFYFITSINESKTESNSGRYFTTKQVLKQIAQNPLGQGVNSFSLEYNKAKAQYFETHYNWEEMKNAGYIYNANNDFLELTFELGVVWTAIFILFILLLFNKKDRTFEIQIGQTILLCLLVFSLTNNILTIPIFVIIAIICTVIIVNAPQTKIVYEFENKTIYKYIGIGFILVFASLQINRINAEFKLYKLYEGKIYYKGENQLQGYLSKIDNEGEELFVGGIILIKNGYKNKGIEHMQTGFEHSGKPSLGRVLANGLQKQKKYVQAEVIYNYNKNAEPYRYEARMDLFTLFVRTKQKEKARKMGVEIIGLPVKIPSTTIVVFKKKAKSYLEFESK